MLSTKGFRHLSRILSIKSKLFKEVPNERQLLIRSKRTFSSNIDHNLTSPPTNKENGFKLEDKEFEDLSIDQFEGLITNGEIREKIQLILSEYEYEKYTTLRVPKTLTCNQMKDLLSGSNSVERKRLFHFWYKKQILGLKDRNKKILRSEQILAKNEIIYSEKNAPRTGIFNNQNNLVYGLWHNTLFTRIAKTSLNRLVANKLKNALLFGQKIVFDLDYDRYMKLIECRLLAKQLSLCYHYNKYATRESFDLHFTNCDHSMPTMKALSQRFLDFKSDDWFISSQFHQQSYLDLFPKESLVYLTPNADKPLLNFSHDDIYIIGGLIDKTYHEPVTYIKAKKEGIRCYRLPIDEFILWSSGTKYLCLNHVLAILHDVKQNGNNWSEALRKNVPQRKQKKVEEVHYEEVLRLQKMKRNLNRMPRDRRAWTKNDY